MSLDIGPVSFLPKEGGISLQETVDVEPSLQYGGQRHFIVLKDHEGENKHKSLNPFSAVPEKKKKKHQVE